MKLHARNIWIAFKDQLPLSRIWRNFRKGYIYGLFHKRSHTNANGTPKVTYNTKKTAVRVAAEMTQKKGVHFSNYKCIWCDGYHIGKNSQREQK